MHFVVAFDAAIDDDAHGLQGFCVVAKVCREHFVTGFVVQPFEFGSLFVEVLQTGEIAIVVGEFKRGDTVLLRRVHALAVVRRTDRQADDFLECIASRFTRHAHFCGLYE